MCGRLDIQGRYAPALNGRTHTDTETERDRERPRHGWVQGCSRWVHGSFKVAVREWRGEKRDKMAEGMESEGQEMLERQVVSTARCHMLRRAPKMRDKIGRTI